MARYETIPQPIAAIQWDGTNLKDLVVFLGEALQICQDFHSWDDLAEYIKSKNSEIPIAYEAEVSNRRVLHQGEYVVKRPNKKVEFYAPAFFIKHYRVKDAKPSPLMPDSST